MLKENWRVISRAERIGDFLIIICCFFMAYYGRASLIFWNDLFSWQIPFEGDQLAPIKDYFIVLVVALFSYALSLSALGAYSSMRMTSTWELLRISFVSSFISFVALSAALYSLKIDLSRSFMGLFCLLVGLSLTAERYLVLSLLRYWRRRGRNFRNIIVCGMGEQAARIVVEISKTPELGLNVRGFVHLSGGTDSGQAHVEHFKDMLRRLGFNRPIPVIDGKQGLLRALSEYAIDEVIFTDVVDVMPQVEAMVVACSEQGIRTTLVADFFSVGLVRSGLSYFGEIPLIHFQTPPGDRWELNVKRMLDVVVSAMLLVLLAPLFLLIALGIKLDSRGPVFYVQRRVGLNGRLFDLYKFRSMVLDADKKVEDLKHLNEMEGPVFKLTNDPRVTRFGRILRRFSLDELPQFWNVLTGDMSLVGPRPPIPGEVSVYERSYRRRLSMRPGITCIWQVSGRNEIADFDSWVKLDLEYIDNWSLWRDIKLLLKTIPAVIFGVGAR